MASSPLKSLQDLRQVARQLAEAQARREAEQAALEAARQAQLAQQQLFVRAIGKVQPLPDRRLAPPPRSTVAPVPAQRHKDNQAVLRDALSDGLDVSTLLDTDDNLSFRRPGVGPDVTRRLRKGDWAIQREIDLHGFRSDEARVALADFIRQAHRQGLRCVRVVHGKGLGSPGREPVLKSKVHSWLVQKNQVMAFVQARGDEGGAGALVVLLR